MDMNMNISNEKLHPRKVSTPKSFSDMSHSKIDGLSNSNASCLKIDSICIDLLGGNEKKEMENCKHFSIRGYVGEIRKRDKKLCWPFPIDSKHNNAKESSGCTLPLMAAPKFRRWRCQNCLREIGPRCTVGDIETFSRNGHMSACSHCMSSHGEADKLALVLVNNSSSDIIGAQPCTYKRESAGVEGAHKKRDNSDIIKAGDLSSSINGVNHKFREHSSYTAELDPCQKMKKNKRRNTDAIESNCNGFVETCKPIFDDQAAELMTVCGISKEKDKYDKPVFATSDHENENKFREYSPSDSDEIIGRQNRFAKHDENSSTTKPRRKARLLSDILLALDGRAISANNVKSCENPSTSSGQTKKRKPTRDKDASLKRGSQAGNSDRGDKHVVDGNSIPNKKLKKPCLDDRRSSLSPLQEVSYGGNEKRGQDPNKSNTSDTTDSTYQSSTGKATESVLFPAKESEKISSLCKKKSKVLQTKTPQTIPMPFSVEPMQTGIMQNYVPYLQPRQDFLLTGKEGISRKGQMSRKGLGCKYIGESSRPCKSSLDARTANRVQWDLNFKTGASIFSEKPSLSKSKEGSESVRVKEGSKSVEEHSVRNGDKVLEKEAINDIPIEIIQLLAKHPYEKRLKDAEKVSNFSDSANKVNNGKGTDAEELHANGELNFIEERNHGLLRSYSSNSNKNGFTKGESAQFLMNTIWPSMIQNHMSYGLQATGQDKHSRLPEYVLNGKNYNYDLNFSNVNVGSYGKQNMIVRSSEVANKTLGEDPSTCNKRIDLEGQMKGSASVYPNEVIPAMHLLSLMDSGRQSSAPFNLDQQKTELIKRPPLPYNRHTKELSWPSHVSKHATSVDYGKKYSFSEKSCECLSAMPAFGALTPSLQNDTSVRRIADSHGQVPKKYTGKSKANPRLGDFHRNGQLSNKKKGLVDAYTIVHPSQKDKKMDGSMTINELKSQYGNESIRPVKRKPKMEMCIVNRNPADFTLPVAGNEYMLSGDDLYLGRKRQHIALTTSINQRGS